MNMPGSKLQGVPPSLFALMTNIPPATAWISEAATVAAHLAYADAARLPTAMMLDRIYNASKRMIASPMYRVLAKVASPRLLLRGAEMSWRLLHRGVDLSIRFDEKAATILATHPPHLWTDVAHEGAAVGFRSVIESAGGTEVRCRVISSLPERGEFELRWT